MKIIPAIDIIDGKCVRLSQGDYNQKTIYNEDPLEVAKNFEGAGIQYLHVVDLDGAKGGEVVNYKVLEKIANKTALHVDFGGGIKTEESLKIAFESGAAQVTLGSIAAKNKELTLHWLEVYGADKLILGADTKAGKIATDGWLKASEMDVTDFIVDYHEQGFSHVISTDINKDGMLQGPSIELYQDIQQAAPKVNVIASGGVSSLKDLEALGELKVYGVIIGKAIYENRISLKDLKRWL
jgi:phosphoribosylformimino-5-aminoimidazole carboxamide ribotide isomerase